MEKGKIKTVFPGDFIATEEEFVAGRNAYEEDGEVKAAIIGKVDFDDERKEASVKGKTVSKLRAGDIVIAKVVKKRDSMITVEILGTEERRAVTLKSAKIPVRNAAQAFVEDMRQLFKIGDFVRAKVVVATPLQVDLATNEKGLGVVEAKCNVCKNNLDYSNGKMMCLNCGNVEERKWFDAEDERSERRDSGRGGFHGRRDSRGGDRRGGDRRSDSRGRRDSRHSGGRDSRHSGGRDNRGGDRRDSRGGRSNFSRGNSRGGFRNENRDNKPRQGRN